MIRQLKPLWLYLARRDKTEVTVLLLLNSENKQLPVRVHDLSVLQLPAALEADIREYADERRMRWEVWVETADTYEDLRTALRRRGYRGLPLNGQAVFTKTSLLNIPPSNPRTLPQVKMMVRRAPRRIAE